MPCVRRVAPYFLKLFIVSLPLILFMALNTKIRHGRKRDQIPISRSVGNMATQALNREVFVSRIDHLLPHRMARMLRPIVACLTDLDHGGLLQKKIAIRRMGRMTRLAIPRLDGIMGERTLDHPSFCGSIFLLLFFSIFSLRLHGIDMTLPTQTLHVGHEKLFLWRGMGLMAVQTTHLIHQGPVDPILIKCIIHHAAVASTA